MSYLWHRLENAIPLITHGDPFIMSLLWITIRVALVSTAVALVIGLPIGLALGLGRFRGRRTLRVLANASLAVPPVVVGVFVLLLILPQGILGSLRIEFTLWAVYLVQTILALPYIVALTPAAIDGLPSGLISQARLLGARRLQLAVLALREAKVGVMAAVIAALGQTISAVGAVIIVGGNVQGHDETLSSALLVQSNYNGRDPYETAIMIVLLALLLVLIGALTAIQQYGGGIRLRFRTS
jgi:tungstate transport system permease protein